MGSIKNNGMRFSSYLEKPRRKERGAIAVYTASGLRANAESKDRRSRPAMRGLSVNIADYDAVYIGFPIWRYTHPTLINSFMESVDYRGKTFMPFATSGGSSTQKAENDLKSEYPEAVWKRGMLMNSISDEGLDRWG